MSRKRSLVTTISIILNVFFVIYLTMDYSGKFDKTFANEQVVEEEAVDPIAQLKEIVLERERAKLPLTTQEFNEVHSIKIDSLVLTKTTSPYEGYLVTTWDYDDWDVSKKKTVYVEISNLRTNRNRETSWTCGWMRAHLSLI